MNSDTDLEKLLRSLFNIDELRRWVRGVRPELLDELPGMNVPLATFAAETVTLLQREGLVRDPAFWAALHAARPRRGRDIDRVQALFPADSATDPAPAPNSAAAAGLTILLASASPAEQERLRVDRECREIVERLRGTRHRDRIRLHQLPALRFRDLRTALLEHRPQILHISSHGALDGSLLLEGEALASREVRRASLKELLAAAGHDLRLLVLNACDSEQLAREVAGDHQLAIGMNGAVADDPAIEFAVAFYEAIGFGESVERAFGAALSGLDPQARTVPRLFPLAHDNPLKQRPLIA